jgi:hypothetical protein
VTGRGNPGDRLAGRKCRRATCTPADQRESDLDGNGVLSLFQVSGSIGAGYVLNIAPNFVVVRPDE